MAGAKGKSGGLRTNAGRPHKIVNYDSQFKSKLKAAINKAAKEHGKNVWEVAVGMMYEEKTQDVVKASILKTIKEAFVTTKSESDVKVSTPSGPGIFLPEQKIDPSEEVG